MNEEARRIFFSAVHSYKSLSKEKLMKCYQDNLPKKTRTEGFSLAKWKLFDRLKKKEQPQAEDTTPKQELQEPEEKQDMQEKREEPTDVPIKEYDETLYSKGSEQKQQKAAAPEKKHPLRRTSWENADTIGQNIDSMRRRQTESTACSDQDRDDTDKKVDLILLKKKSRF